MRSGRLGLQKWLGFWLLQNYLDYLLQILHVLMLPECKKKYVYFFVKYT
jgi:hypothetical protein